MRNETRLAADRRASMTPRHRFAVAVNAAAGLALVAAAFALVILPGLPLLLASIR
jgi:hypothetical protein